jgi:hypothetical protein
MHAAKQQFATAMQQNQDDSNSYEYLTEQAEASVSCRVQRLHNTASTTGTTHLRTPPSHNPKPCLPQKDDATKQPELTAQPQDANTHLHACEHKA